MSWFSDLTGKAGAFLDRMDQAAAVSLQDAGLATPSPQGKGGKNPRDREGVNTTVPYEPTAYQSLSTPSERGAAVAQVLVGSASGSSQLASTPKTPLSQQRPATASGQKQLATDDSIFEFLNAPTERSSSRNSSSRASSTQRMAALPSSASLPDVTKTPSPVPSERNRPHPSPMATPTHPQTAGRDEEEERVQPSSLAVENKERSEERVEGVDGAEIPDPTEDKQPAQLEVGVVMGEVPPAHQVELEEWKQRVSNLELENKLMKREVSSLNEELSSVTLRVREASASRAQYEAEIQGLREQVSRADHALRQLRSHEEDLQASLEARDSQIEVLRTQLAAADRALSESKEQVAFSKREQER